ncbi:unnamed protein product [Timema podura]|uniref:Uncharacterized protein n=1 Tax=Timema podura TaxID=61482 RepID=A0ABN7PTE1_TIMPD|nr:unnamed protein product [Timema podura]
MPLAAPPVPTSAVAPQMRTSFESNPPKPQQSVPLFGGPKASFSSPGTGAGFALTTDNQSPANFSYSLPGTPGTNTPSSLLQKVGSQPEQSTAASEQISRPTPHTESPPIILNIPPVPITAPQLSRPAVMGDNVAGQNTGREESTTDSVVCVAAIRDETFTFHKEMTDLLASVSALDCKVLCEDTLCLKYRVWFQALITPRLIGADNSQDLVLDNDSSKFSGR